MTSASSPSGRGAVENWGYFDDAAREFVLTTPRPPRHWKNILWNRQYNWQVTQSGDGIAYRRDDDGTIILITWMGNQCWYVVDEETGEQFSVGYWPTCNEDYEGFSSRYGMGYQVIEQQCLGVRVTMTAIVPLEGHIQMVRFELENLSGRPRRLSVVPHLDVNISFSDPYHGKINRFECLAEPAKGFLCIRNIAHLATRQYNACLSSSQPIADFAFDKEEFIGVYGNLARPEKIASPLDGSLDAPENPAVTARIPVELAGRAKATLDMAFGNIAHDPNLQAASMAAVREGAFQRELDLIRKQHEQRYATLTVQTGDADFDRFVNIWLQHQLAYCAYWNRGWAKGFRDGMQDAWAYLLIEPQHVRTMIADALPHQFADGRTLRKWATLDRKEYNDGPVWLALAVAAYVAETGDAAFLGEDYGFFESDERGTVMEHLRRGMTQLYDKRGERGLCLMPYGDWNDQLTGPGEGGKGESVWTTLAFATALPRVAELAELVADAELAKYCRKAYDDVKQAIQANAWNGKWFVRATCDDGSQIGLPTDKYGRIWLLPQAWSILSDIATPEQTESLIAAVNEQMLVDFGYLLLTPGWREHDPRIGNLSMNPAGFVENGSNYCHATAFMMNALCKCGRVDNALDVFHRLMPTNPANPPSKSHLEPFSFTNSYFGPEIGAKAGRAMFSWRTGTAGWVLRTAVEGILGIKAELTGLRISRAWPSDWKQASVRRNYRGKRVTVQFKQTGKAGMAVNGKAVEGDFVPVEMITDGCQIVVQR